MSRLGLGLGLTKGGVIPFNPLSLDPYLLFDTQSSMIGTFENPTLDLDPSVPSSLDIITATRAGTATVTDASGNIVDAAPNTVRVDHVQGEIITAARTNLMGYSEPTLAQYDNVSGGGISEVVVADSGLTQWTQWDDTTGSSHRYVNINFTFTVGPTYVFSFYIRMNDGGAPVVGNSGTGALADLAILIEGSSSSGTSGGIENVGSGLYRVWGKRTATGSSTALQIRKYINNSARGFRVSGLQVEQATAPTALIDNDTGAPITVPAVYGPRVPMILVEPSATNLLPYSEDFSTWSIHNVSLSTGFASPDGLLNARNITPEATSSTHLIVDYPVSSDMNTYSIYAKANGYKYFRFNTGSSSNGFAEFDVEAGSVVDTGGTYHSSSSIEDVGDGWFRCSMTLSAGNPNGITVAIENNDRLVSFLGDEVSSLLFWGAQVETGSVATSYIPTSGSAATRAKDDLVISGSDFSDFYNQSEGTVYAEFVPKRNNDYRHVYEFSNGTTAQRINLHLQSAEAIFYSQSSGSLYVNSTNSVAGATIDVLHRSAFSYKINDAPCSFDGGAEIPDAEYSVPSGINRLYLGDYTPRDGNYILNGHIKRLIYWPYHSDSL